MDSDNKCKGGSIDENSIIHSTSCIPKKYTNKREKIMNHKKSSTYIRAGMMLVLVIFTAGSSLPTALAQGGDGAVLFSEAAPTADMLAKDVGDQVARSRFVNVNLDVLKQADVGSPPLTLNMFDDVVYTGVVTKTEKVTANSISRIGELTNVDNGYFYLVTYNDVFMAHVASAEGVYEVTSAGNGIYQVKQIDQSKFSDHPAGVEPMPSSDAVVLEAGSLGANADSANQIDVMVVYTTLARIAAGGTSAIKTLINLAVSETNQGYLNAGITTRIRLVHTVEVNYAEQLDMSIDLDRIENPSDGYIDHIHSLRNWFGADMVNFMVSYGPGSSYGCGLASGIFVTASDAFQITDMDCATGNYSFGHEFGHLQGAGHDHLAHVPSTLWYVNSAFAYGHGYVYWSAAWRTIMAYNTECSYYHSVDCIRLQWWSNPNKTNGGQPMGTPDDEENYRVLNTTAYTVANFRKKVLTPKKLFNPIITTTDLTPKFEWSKVPGATYYQIQVKQGLTTIYKKSYKYNCQSTICSKSPGTPLLLNTKYKWRIRAKVGGTWRAWSPYMTFKTIPKSFSNDFNYTHPGWASVKGTWSHVAGVAYGSPGVKGKWASIKYKDDYKNGTYTVRMGRGGCSWCSNTLIIRGNPTSPRTDGTWRKGYYFQYTNDKRISVWKFDGSTIYPLKNWTTSNAVKPYSWNTLKVVFSGKKMIFYVNGVRVATVSDSSLTRGQLGVTFYRDPDSTNNVLYVDWVKFGGGVADELPGATIIEGMEVPGGTVEGAPK